MLQSLLKDREEVNAALTIIQSRIKNNKKDYLAITNFVSVLLPFKKEIKQVEGKNIVTSSCICPVVVSLTKAFDKVKYSNLSSLKKLAMNLQPSFLNIAVAIS